MPSVSCWVTLSALLQDTGHGGLDREAFCAVAAGVGPTPLVYPFPLVPGVCALECVKKPAAPLEAPSSTDASVQTSHCGRRVRRSRWMIPSLAFFLARKALRSSFWGRLGVPGLGDPL